MLVLGIETSCDETAAAIVRDGREIVSSVIASQIETHKRFGGVVPELASREHLDKIVPIVEEAFSQANTQPEQIDGIAGRLAAGRRVLRKGDGVCPRQAAGGSKSHRRSCVFRSLW